MTVDFYIQTDNCQNWQANKLVNMTKRFSTECEPRMPFNPLNPQFILQGMPYSFNYIKYHYAPTNTDYYCYADFTEQTAGQFIVNGYIDPLTTSWYSGCIQSSYAKIKYSDLGSTLLTDDRISYKQVPVRQYVKLDGRYVPYEHDVKYYSITVLTGYPDPKNFNNTYSKSTTSVTYIVNKDTLHDFLDKFIHLPAEKAKVFTLCIQNIMPLRGFSYQQLSGLPTTGTIKLYAVYNPVDFNVGKPDLYTEDIPLLSSTAPNNAKIIDGVIRQYNTYDVDITLNTVEMKSNFCFTMDSEYSVNFIPSQTINTNKITRLGFVFEWDFIGSRLVATPIINNQQYPEYAIIRGFPTVMPTWSTKDVTSFDQNFNGTAVGAAIGSVALLFATGGASIPVTAGITSAAVGTVANSVIDAVRQTNKGVTISSEKGAAIGTITENGDYYLYNKIEPYTNITAYQNVRGKPDGEYRRIGDIPSGYVQTEDIHLNVLGLPMAIISATESQCNSGFYIMPE